MEKFKNFCLQKWIFAVFAFLLLFLANFEVFGLNTEFFPVISGAMHLLHMKEEELGCSNM
jgi:hypothetical protein